MSIGSIDVVSVPVADQERSRDFYVDKLGFSVTTDADFGQRWLELEPPGGGARITLVTWFEQMPPGSQQGLVLASDDVASDVEALRERGIEIGDPQEESWGTFASLRDPDGNSWVLVQRSAD
jgi:catechol 2,3-dioxygenase-like lactoylglutathione lyase family enzyme